MQAEEIANSDRVTRNCGESKIDNGRVRVEYLIPRPDDYGVSSNWVEYHSSDLYMALRCITQELTDACRHVGAKSSFAVLHASTVRQHTCVHGIALDVEYTPDKKRNILSHTDITGCDRCHNSNARALSNMVCRLVPKACL